MTSQGRNRLPFFRRPKRKGTKDSIGETSPPASPTATENSRDFERIELANAIQQYSQSSVRLDNAIAKPLELENAFKRLDLSEKRRSSTADAKIKLALDGWNNATKYHVLWAKYTRSLQRFFTVLNPFTDFIQDIGKMDGLTNFDPYKPICDAFHVLLSVSDRDERIGSRINRILAIICKEFRRCSVVTFVAGNQFRKEHETASICVINLASHSMQYLSNHVSKVSEFDKLGLSRTGNAEVEQFLRALDKDISVSDKHLIESVDSYNTAVKKSGFSIVEYKESQGPEEQNLGQIGEIFLVPYQRHDNFRGRDKVLHDLREQLIDESPRDFSHRIALYGMGGVGKTQVAVEYVYRFRSNYDYIFWIPSADQLSVLNGFQRVAQAIGIGGSTGEVVSEVMELVFAWLKSKQRWLLVFDGLDEISVVNGLLPDNGPDRHTLITTRNPRVWSLPAVGLEVPPLQLGESIDLFYTLSQVPISLEPVEQSALHEIVTQLGHLPLAIAQAASYIRETSVSIAAFRDAYNKIEEPRRTSRGDYRYKQTISKTFSLSFKMVANDYPPARELLQLLSFLNPDGVLVDFLTTGAQTLKSNPSLYQAMADRSQVIRAISVLERFSLVKFDNPNQTIYIHRLVQATLRDQMSLFERQDSLSTVIALCDFSFPRDINDKTITQCRRFLGQVVEPLLALRTIETLECAMLKERVARFLTSEGKYQESAAMLLQAIETREVVSGNEHPDTINDLSSLADVYIYQGRLDDAASLEERILRMRENLLGNDHPDTITTLSNLAAVYSQQQGRLDEALKIEQQVLEKRMALLGPRHVDTMNTLSRLARTYSQQGRYEEARRLAEGVLESRRMVLGEENPETLIAMNDLALICRKMGGYDEAERHMKQALDASFRVLGPEHSDSIMAMGNLALIYGEEGKATEARELEEKVLAYNLKFRGPEHSYTLTAMTNLAETCYLQGDFPAAVRLWEQSVTARENTDGENSPATLATILRLGEAYRKLKRFDEAISLLERVLSKRVMLFGREHPETLNAMLLLAVTYLDIGRGVEASAMLERVFEGTERVLGTNHPTTTTAMYYLSVAYKAVGKYQEAARLDKMLESVAPGLRKLMDARP